MPSSKVDGFIIFQGDSANRHVAIPNGKPYKLQGAWDLDPGRALLERREPACWISPRELKAQTCCVLFSLVHQ